MLAAQGEGRTGGEIEEVFAHVCVGEKQVEHNTEQTHNCLFYFPPG